MISKPVPIRNICFPTGTPREYYCAMLYYKYSAY